MDVIITKQNLPYFQSIWKAITSKVIEQTTSTLTIRVTTKRMESLIKKVKEDGNNPYAVMAW